jgi:hypothetical protein
MTNDKFCDASLPSVICHQNEPAALFLRAALAPSFPRAVLTFLGKCEMVLFRLAALAAVLMFFRAAASCLVVVMGLIGFGNSLTSSPSIRVRL